MENHTLDPNKVIPIVIVTWNNEEDIRECLQSIRGQSHKNHPVIVVDNASTDDTVKIIKNDFPEVTVIEQEQNRFLTPSNNLGLKFAISEYSCEYVMVLNPDTKADNLLLEVMALVLEVNSEVAAVGPKVKFWKSNKEGKLNSTGLLYDGFMQAYDRGFMEEDSGQYNQQEEVFGVTGACILFRTKALQDVGFYWERIKMHLDEVELFIRLQKKGWKTVYEPSVTLWHAYMRSSEQQYTGFVDERKLKAWLAIGLKHYSWKSKLAILKKYLELRK